MDQCDVIETGYSIRLEGDAFGPAYRRPWPLLMAVLFQGPCPVPCRGAARPLFLAQPGGWRSHFSHRLTRPLPSLQPPFAEKEEEEGEENRPVQSPVVGGKSGKQRQRKNSVENEIEALAVNSEDMQVRGPTTWTTTRHDGPNHLGLWCDALPEHQMALITSDCRR